MMSIFKLKINHVFPNAVLPPIREFPSPRISQFSVIFLWPPPLIHIAKILITRFLLRERSSEVYNFFFLWGHFSNLHIQAVLTMILHSFDGLFLKCDMIIFFCGITSGFRIFPHFSRFYHCPNSRVCSRTNHSRIRRDDFISFF